MLRRWLLSWLLLPFALILPDQSRGDEPAPPPKEAPNRAQVDRLIRQLGSDQFNERETASRQLELGPRPLRPCAGRDGEQGFGRYDAEPPTSRP